MFPYLSVVPEQASGVFETTPSFTAKTGRRVLLSLFLLLLTHKMAPTSRVSSTAGRKIHHHDQLQKGLACDCWCVPPLLDLGASSPTDGLRGQSSSQGSLHGGDSCLQCLLANGKVRGQSGGGLRLSLLGQDEGEESQAEGSQDRGACGDATGYANLQTTVAFSLGSSLTLTFRRVNSFFYMKQLARVASNIDRPARRKGTHYIWTIAQVQYKRLFEFAAGQINQRRAAHI